MKIGNTFSSIALIGLCAAALSPHLAGQSVSSNPISVALSAANASTAVVTQTLTLTVTGGGGQTLSVSTAGGTWLRVIVSSIATCQTAVIGCNIPNPGSTVSVTVQADPTNLVQNTYNGSISLTLTGSSGSVQVPVTFQVGAGSGGGTSGLLVASPTQLNFTGLPGSGSQSQNVGISNSGTSINYNVSSNQTWLTTNLGIGAGTSPGTLSVSVSGAGLAANTYSGTLTLTPVGGGQATTIQVTFLVSSNQQFQINPSALSFSYINGSGAANPFSNLAVGVTTGSAVSYTLTTIYGAGATGWLGTNPLNGGTTGTSVLPTTVTVTPNAVSLGIGTYTATLRFSATGFSVVDIPITLVVSSAPTFVVTPSPVNISVQPSTVTSRILNIGTSNNATVNYSVTSAYTSPVTPLVQWLTIGGGTGTTPNAVTIGVNPLNLAVGTYVAQLTIASSTPGVLATTVTVNMTVTTSQIVTFAPSSLNFNFAGGGVAPSSQSVQLGLVPANPPQSANVGAVPDVPGQTWLSATLSSPNGQNITGNTAVVVNVNPTGLANGTYTGKVQIFVFGTVNNPSIDIPVSLTVTNVIGGGTGGGTATPTVLLSQGQFVFNATPGGVAPDQTLQLASNSSTPINYSLSTTTSWLTIFSSSGSTPGSAIVRPTAGALTPGTYTGQIILTAPGASNNGLGIPVTFTINAANQLQTTPSGFSFDYVAQSGSFPTSKTLQLSSTTGATLPVSATVTTNTGGAWLSVLPLTVNTLGQMVISINSTILQGLPVGSYSANISLQATGALNPIVNVPVSLNITGTSSPGTGATQLILGPNPINFYSNVGGTTPAQVLDINTLSGVSANYSLNFSVTSGGNWLSLGSTSGSTPGQVVVSANTSSLGAGTYSGSIAVTSPGATNSGTAVPVTLTISNQANLVANPAGITVNYPIGGPAIPTRFITLSTTTGAAVPVSVTTTSTNNFLSVVTSSSTTPSTVSVSINAAGLAAGVYSGTIFVTGSGASNSPLSLPVTLIVTGTGAVTSQLSLSPNSLSFFAQPNGTPPQQRAVQVSSTGSAISYAVSSNQTWLLAGPGSGTTPGTITVGVSPVGLSTGIYSGNVTVTGGGSSISLPVSLEITNNPLLQLGQQSVTFNYQTGQALPSPRPILVTASNGGALSSSVTLSTSNGGNWLLVSPTSLQTPGAFAISLANNIVSTLAAGTYTGTVTVNAAGAANTNATVNVTLNVSSSALITMSTTPATFNAQFGGSVPPPTQARQITSTSGQLSVSVSTSTNGGSNWLSASVNTNTTPATLTIGTSASGLGTGVYTGSVTVTSGSAASALVIPITLNVSSLPLISVDRPELIFGAGGNSGTQPQTLQISSSGTNFNYTVQANVTNSPTNWLSASAVNGVTPSSLVVTVNPALLGDGTYFGTIVIGAPGSGNSPLVIPVTLTVNQATALVVSPTSLSFTQIQGGAPPAQQPVQVTSQLPSQFNVTSAVQTPVGGNWLVVNQSGGITNGFLQVSLNNTASSLPPGTYTATITVFGPNSPNSVALAVTLNVVAAVSIQVSPASLSFNGRAGQPNPPTQTLQVTPASTATVPVTYNVTSDATWLTATPLSGTTPGTLTVTASTTGLAAGSYTGRLTITPSGSISVGQATVVTVTFQVDQVTAPNITGFANAAFVPGPLSPGMIITLVGTNLGPTTAVQGQVVGGRFTTALTGVRVLFDGIAAPVLYASSTQINAVVPYSLAGRASSRMTVEYNNVVSTSLEPRIVDSAPGIFTTDGRQVAMFNENGTYNSSANPATAGTIVVVYVTGEGSTNPAGVDGEIIGSNLKRPIAPVRVRVGGIEVPAADILYAGSAPTLVSGLMQINFRLPANTPTGPNTSLEVIVGSAASQPGVVMAVR